MKFNDIEFVIPSPLSTGGPSGCPADVLGPGGTELDDIEFVDIEFELSSPCNICGPSGCPFDVVDGDKLELDCVELKAEVIEPELDSEWAVAASGPCTPAISTR